MAQKKDICKQLADEFGCIGKWSFGSGYYSSSDGNPEIVNHSLEDMEYRDYCYTRCRYSFQCWETFITENNFSYDDEIAIGNLSFQYYVSGIRTSFFKLSN